MRVYEKLTFFLFVNRLGYLPFKLIRNFGIY